MPRFWEISSHKRSLRVAAWGTFALLLGVLLAFFGAKLFPVFPRMFIGVSAPALEYTGDVGLPSILPRVEEVTMLFAGDIMLDRGVRKAIRTVGDGDYHYPFLLMHEEIKGADIAFANLEGPISNTGVNVGSIYSFRMEPASAFVLRDVGFDVVSFANNHVGDWGVKAFSDTLKRLGDVGVAVAGAGKSAQEAHTPRIIERKGVRVGFLAYSDVGPKWLRAGSTTPGIALAEIEAVDRDVRHAQAEVDILVVSFHFGEEYETTSNARERALARAAIDSGASIVIGHHPHVAQETEMRGEGFIAYSLGNFVFDQRFSPETSSGLIARARVTKDGVKSFQVAPVYFNETFQPMLNTYATSSRETN